MPVNPTSGSGALGVNPLPPVALWPGDEIYSFGTKVYVPGEIAKPNDANVVFEALVVGARSNTFTLAARPGGGAPPGVFVQVIASANPGAAEIDVQDAAVDADGAFVTPVPSGSTAWKITTWAAIAGGRYIATTALQPEGGHFNSLLVVANPNAVSFTAKVVYV